MQKLFLPALLLILSIACQKANTDDITNLNCNEIAVYGHGGMGIESLLPLNSFRSIEKCLEQGAAGTEIDVQLTLDNVLVAYHDPDLSSKTDCSGQIASLNRADLQDCGYSKKHDVITLDDLFSRISNPTDYIFTLDCKLHAPVVDEAYLNRYATAIDDLANRHQLRNNLFIETQSRQFLTILQDQAPDFKLFIYPANFDEGLSIAAEMDLFGITFAVDQTTAAQVDQAHEMGFRVTLWNTHSKKRNKTAVEMHPDYIQTDNLNYLLNTLTP